MSLTSVILRQNELISDFLIPLIAASHSPQQENVAKQEEHEHLPEK